MSLPGSLLRSVTQDEIDTFWRDGVVCLRDIIPLEWIDSVSGPVDAALSRQMGLDLTDIAVQKDTTAAPTEAGSAEQVRPDRRGHFIAIGNFWRKDATFKAFCTASPVPEIAGRLMRSKKVNLFNDAVFVKEPGSEEPTAFHQDLSYFAADGEQMCTMWIALDKVTQETGAVQFIKGSHLWPGDFRPSQFTTNAPMAETDGQAVPDFSTDTRGQTILSFDLNPGDLTVHHTRTIHGAGGNTSNSMRRGVSLRYCGDDAVYKFKRFTLPMPHENEVVEGAPLDHPECPVVWRDTAGATP